MLFRSPILSAYTDQELEMINAAAKMVGAGPVKRMTNNRSEELSNTNKASAVPHNSGSSKSKKKKQ